VSRLGDELRRTFVAVRGSRNFRLYLTGQLVSATGTWMHFTASSWLIYELTSDGVALGVNGALLFGPMLVLGPYGGVLADRFDKRRILIATQAAFAAQGLAMAGLVGAGVIELWMVYALSLVAGVFIAIDNPARQSFYVEMVGEEHLTNAVSLHSATFTGSRILGSALAGILIAAAGVGVCFLIDGLSYVAVIGALLAMRPEELHPQARSDRQRGHLLAGLRYVWATAELRRPLLAAALVFTVAFQFGVSIPLFAADTLRGGPEVLGWLGAFAGLGLFLGAITMANRNVAPTMHRLGVFSAAFGVAMVLAGLAPAAAVAYAAMVPLGFVSMSFMITGNTLLQLRAPAQARGRVMALYGAAFLGSTPLGSVLVGWIGQVAGARATFFVGGAVALVVGAFVLRGATAPVEPIPTA
jgi:MFS family permease